MGENRRHFYMLHAKRKIKAIAKINSYFQDIQNVHKDQSILLIKKVDPMLLGSFITPGILKKIRFEFKILMKAIATDFAQALNRILKKCNVQASEVQCLASTTLKCHQKLIMANFLEHLHQNNPKSADTLKIALEQFTDIVMPIIRKNNSEVFSSSQLA